MCGGYELCLCLFPATRVRAPRDSFARMRGPCGAACAGLSRGCNWSSRACRYSAQQSRHLVETGAETRVRESFATENTIWARQGTELSWERSETHEASERGPGARQHMDYCRALRRFWRPTATRFVATTNDSAHSRTARCRHPIIRAPHAVTGRRFLKLDTETR